MPAQQVTMHPPATSHAGRGAAAKVHAVGSVGGRFAPVQTAVAAAEPEAVAQASSLAAEAGAGAGAAAAPDPARAAYNARRKERWDKTMLLSDCHVLRGGDEPGLLGGRVLVPKVSSGVTIGTQTTPGLPPLVVGKIRVRQSQKDPETIFRDNSFVTMTMSTPKESAFLGLVDTPRYWEDRPEVVVEHSLKLELVGQKVRNPDTGRFTQPREKLTIAFKTGAEKIQFITGFSKLREADENAIFLLGGLGGGGKKSTRRTKKRRTKKRRSKKRRTKKRRTKKRRNTKRRRTTKRR